MESFRSFAFGAFCLIPERQLLLRDEVPVRLGGRAIDLLTVLVERPGQLISKAELVTRAWPNTVVVDANLKVNMMALRRAIGDGLGNDRYIATVPGRGYRFVAPVQETGRSEAATLLRTGAERKNNLPVSGASIFGRAEAIESLRKEVDSSRLICITGAGGIGKTTVALAVAEQCLSQFEDGVWLVDLARSREPQLTANAIATAVGLTNHSADVLASLCEFLRGREALVVLDNCEHVVESAAACVGSILAAAPRVKILATSREPLLVKGERVRRLQALALPPGDAALKARDAMKFPSIQLFVERATDRLEAFTLSDEEAPLVGEICRRLDGLALAIEIAATRVDAFGVRGLLAQLDDRFRLLRGLRSSTERQRTLLATLDWSYELLSESEAALLRAVSVFAGPFDMGDAAAVLNSSPTEAAAALSQLATKSLLVVDAESAMNAGAVAYRLLESTRVYSLGRLGRDADEERRVRTLHAERVCQVLARARGERASMPAPQWGARYGHLLDDLQNALAWARHTSTDPTLSVRITVAGIALWEHFSLTIESRAHFAAAIRQLEAAGLTGSPHEMQLSLGLGASSMYTVGLQDDAERAMQRALEIATTLGDTDCQLRCLMSISAYQMLSGKLRVGKRSLDAFAEIAAAKDPDILVASEIHHGVGELMLGELQSAIRRFEAVQQRDFRNASAASLGYVLDPYALAGGILCQAQWLVGLPETALRTAQACLEAGRASGHHLTINNALSITCAVLYWTGRYEDCERNVVLLEEHFSRHGIITRRPTASFYRAALSWSRRGATVEVIHALAGAIEDFRRTNHLVRMPYYKSVLAEALTQAGRLDEAEATIAEALDIAVAQEEGWCLAEVLRVEALVLTARGERAQAEHTLARAITEADQVGARSWRLRAAVDAARLRQESGDTAAALGLLQSTLHLFPEGFETRDLQAATDLMATLQATVGVSA